MPLLRRKKKAAPTPPAAEGSVPVPDADRPMPLTLLASEAEEKRRSPGAAKAESAPLLLTPNAFPAQDDDLARLYPQSKRAAPVAKKAAVPDEDPAEKERRERRSAEIMAEVADMLKAESSTLGPLQRATSAPALTAAAPPPAEPCGIWDIEDTPPLPVARDALCPTGWVVVIDGPGLGESLALGQGRTILALPGLTDAAITFDPAGPGFVLTAPGTEQALVHGQTVTLGQTVLKFAALCDDAFTWASAQAASPVAALPQSTDDEEDDDVAIA